MAYRVIIDCDKELIVIDGKGYTLKKLMNKRDRTDIETEILESCKRIFKNKRNEKSIRGRQRAC